MSSSVEHSTRLHRPRDDQIYLFSSYFHTTFNPILDQGSGDELDGFNVELIIVGAEYDETILGSKTGFTEDYTSTGL